MSRLLRKKGDKIPKKILRDILFGNHLMVVPLRKRKLQLETLELRTLLDGNIAVSILDGNLVLQGDALGNAASVEQLAAVDPSGAVVAAGSFQIVPDENTSLNDGKPGEALTVSGVTGGVMIGLGGGDDRIKMDGAQGQSLSFLKIEMGAGADAAQVSNVTVAGALTIESRGALDAGVDETQAADIFLKFESAAGKRSSASLSDVQVAHKLDLESSGGVDVSAARTRAASGYIKFEDIKGEAALATTSLDGLTVDGDLTIASRGVTQKLDASNVEANNLFLKYEGPRDRSSASIANSQILHKLELESTGAVDVSVQSTRAADMFIKVEFPSRRNERSSVLLSDVDLDGQLDVVSVAPLDFTGHKLSASDLYLKYEVPSSQRSSASLSDFHVLHKLDIESNGALDVSVGSSSAASGFLKFDGIKGESTQDTTSLDGLTVNGDLIIFSRGVMNKVEAANVKAANIFLKFEGASGQRSSASLSKFDVLHKLDIESGGALDVSVQQTRAVDMFLKLERTSGPKAVSSIDLSDVDLDGQLDVASLAPLDFSASRLRAVDMFLKITEPKSKISDAKMQGTGSSVSLVDIVLSGQLQISTGNGNDTVLVSGASVEGPVSLDGGGGQDSLTLADNQFAVEPVITGFESVNKQT